MTCPTITREQAEAGLNRARADIMLALQPLVLKHGVEFAVLGVAHVLGDMIGMANTHGQLGGPVSEQMRAVQNMVAAGVRRSTAALHPPEGRA